MTLPKQSGFNFHDHAANPSAAGDLQRNGDNLKWADSTPTVRKLLDSGNHTGIIPINPDAMNALTGATKGASIGFFSAIDMDAGGETVQFNIMVPDDFASIVSAKLVYVANDNKAGTDGFDIYTNWGVAGGDYNAESDNLLDTDTGAKVVGYIYELDISDALTGLAAGDYLGIWITADNSGVDPVDISIIGFKFEYQITA